MGMSSWRIRHEWCQSVSCQFFCDASLLNAQCVSADDAGALCADDIQCDYVQLKRCEYGCFVCVAVCMLHYNHDADDNIGMFRFYSPMAQVSIRVVEMALVRCDVFAHHAFHPADEARPARIG